MNFTLRFVFAATFLSLMFDGTAAHAQQSRRHRRGGQNNYAISQQILARFLANERHNMAMLNNGRAPIYRQIPNASPSPNYTQLPDPATAGLKASFYGTMASTQLTTGKFRQGTVSGAKSLYNAHNAAAGYRARSLPPSGPTGYLTLRQQGIPFDGGLVFDEMRRSEKTEAG